jgi:glucose/arabinose dehydrogenase
LVDFQGRGKYRSPEFTWFNTTGPTALVFLDSDKLGKQYQNDIFVGDYNGGNIYHFDLNQNRTHLALQGPLADRVADTAEESQEIIFGEGFGPITDLQIGPDGYLYVLSVKGGTIYKIIPIGSENS